MFFFYLQRTQRSFIPATPWISRPTPSVRTRGISLIPLNQFKCLNMHFHDFFYTCWNYRVLQTSSETSCSSLGRRNADHQTKGTPVSPSISSPDFSSDALSREILQLYLCFPIFYLYTSTSLLGQIKRNNITPEMFIFPVKILICYYVPQGLSWGNCAHL